ncbi:MAG: hypothetical protein K1X88_15210 [Nannocystaceae bacterium]|nr:hypothetical protein [Nannocystaceae bacterium]
MDLVARGWGRRALCGLLLWTGACARETVGEDDTASESSASVGVDSGSTDASTSSDASDGSSGEATSTGSDTAACDLPPLDETTLQDAFIWAGLFDQVAVGTATPLSLATLYTGFPDPVMACARWSIAPTDGASIDADGVLTIDADTPAGTVYTVTADIEDGRRIVTKDVTTYVPLQQPIVRTWSELSQLPCDGGDPFTPRALILELAFFDNGEAWITWTPFESYVDYTASFTWDPDTGALALTVEGGAYVPPDIDAEGTARIDDDGQLVLEDMFLGSAEGSATPPGCGHVFE